MFPFCDPPRQLGDGQLARHHHWHCLSLTWDPSSVSVSTVTMSMVLLCSIYKTKFHFCKQNTLQIQMMVK